MFLTEESRQQLCPVLFVGLAAFVFNLSELSSFDVWYHLSLGRQISESGCVPRANILSYTAPEHPGPSLSWFFQWLIFQLHRAGGVGAVIVFRSLVVAAILALLLATMRARGTDLLTAMVMLGLGAVAVRSRFVDRPQILGYLMMALMVFALERFRSRSNAARDDQVSLIKSGGWLFAGMAGIQIVWCNSHGSAILGVIVALVYVLGTLFDRFVIKRKTAADFRVFCICLAVIVLVSGLNPDRWRILSYPFTHAHAFESEGTKDFFVERITLEPSSLYQEHLAFSLLMLFGLLSAVLAWRKLSFVDIGLLASMGAVFLSARFLGEAIIFITPVAAGLISCRAGPGLERLLEKERIRGIVGCAALIGLLVLSACLDRRRAGLKISADYPIGAIEYVKENGLSGRVFNDFELGGFLAWHGYEVFMDSRGQGFYPSDLFRKYLDVIDRRYPQKSVQSLRELESRYGFTVAVVNHYMPIKLFRQSPQWQEVYSTSSATVFVKQ